jgi:hypothetical protein
MYHLAEINIARMLAPLGDPIMADFVARLDEVNALADSRPGFVWRLQTDGGDATSIRAYDDPQILVNMSVWQSLDALSQFVYASESRHRDVMKQRRRWFERFDGAYMALWWVPQGHIPTVEEGKDRLDYLRSHGETAYAFSFKQTFPAPDAGNEPLTQIPEPCIP